MHQVKFERKIKVLRNRSGSMVLDSIACLVDAHITNEMLEKKGLEVPK